jgi:ABC-type antimicrobial peptide transport system permease subunit
MILNYLKVAWRNISRNKAFALINVLGLTLGVACVILIYTLVNYHLGFDTYHAKADRTYRVVTEFHMETVQYRSAVPQPLGNAFANDFTFAEKVARIKTYSTIIVSLPGEKDMPKFKEEDGVVGFAEPSLFEILDIPMIRGNSQRSLSEPNTALITKEYARKYFGSDDALDKVIRISFADNVQDFKIVGVLEDTRPNTDLRVRLFVSYSNLKDFVPAFASNSWGSVHSGMQCFVLLKPGVSPGEVDKAFPSLVKKYYDEADARVYVFRLQPLSDIHFNPDFGGKFNRDYLWVFVVIGVFMLAIASFNFINLAAAQIFNRSKEVGVRKVLGSGKSHLFFQFIVETGLIATVAVVSAYALAQMALPSMNALLGERLVVSLTEQWELPVFIASVWMILILISGTYPALMLTRFQPAAVLKGKLSGREVGGFSLRRMLIVTQFVIAQLLIVCMIVIGDQMRYSINADMGFSKDAILLMPIAQRDLNKTKTLRNRMAAVPGVLQTTICFEAPASESNSFTGLRFDNRPQDEPWDVNLKDADEHYLSTFGLELVAGRNLLPSDSVREFLVNETFVKKLGFASPQDVIGRKLYVDGSTMKGTIEGVVKDFYNLSFHETISPVVMCTNPGRYRTFGVRIDLAQAGPVLDAFNRMWTETYPDNIFTYEFLDARIASFYVSDKAILTMVEVVSMIAVLISCLGLYGLVSFMAVRKTKEIGVRKVLGAGVKSILWLFAREFALLILIAFVIAAPLGWVVMNGWLQDFAYKIDVSPMSFAFAIGGTMIVAAATVSYHSLKAAFANPVNSLRTE